MEGRSLSINPASVEEESEDAILLGGTDELRQQKGWRRKVLEFLLSHWRPQVLLEPPPLSCCFLT